MWHLEEPNSERQRLEGWLPGPGGRGNGELVFSGDGMSVWENEKILEISGGEGCTTT